MSCPTIPQTSCLLIFSWSIMDNLDIHQLHQKLTEVSHNYSVLVSSIPVSFSSFAVITTAKTETTSLQKSHKVCRAPSCPQMSFY